MKSIWGVDIQEGVRMLDYIKDAEDAQKARRNFDRALEGEEFTLFEEYGDQKRKRLYYEDFYSPLKDENGHVIGVTVFVNDVSDRRRAALKIEEQEKLLNSINQNISEGLYRANNEGLIYANNAMAEMFGYDRPEDLLKIETLRLYKHPQRRNELIQVLGLEGHYVNEEVVFLKKNGDEFVGLISSTSYRSESGELFWDGAIRDVTEERESRRQIYENKQLLQSINHNINEAIYRSELGKGMIYVNDAFVKMFGYQSSDEVLNGDPSMLYLHPEDRKKLGNMLIQEGSLSSEQVPFKRKDGSMFWGSVTSITSYADDRVFFDGAIRDITIQKKAEEQIQRQSELQRILVGISMEYLNLPITKFDNTVEKSLQELGSFVHADRAYVYDLDPAEGVFLNTHEWIRDKLVHPQNSRVLESELLEEMLESFKKGEPIIMPDITQLKSKALLQHLQRQNTKSLVAVPCMNNQRCAGFVGFDFVKSFNTIQENEVLLLKLFAEMLVNVKNRFERQNDHQKLLDTTTKQNARLKDFSYITSHNIRSSVANFMGLLEIQQNAPNNPEIGRMLRMTAEKLNATITNINELLNFEKQVENMKSSDCNVRETIENALEMCDQMIRTKHARIINEIRDDIWVTGLPAYLDSIFHNLITNALKYGITPKSKEIIIRARKENDAYLVEICDKGLGMNLKQFGHRLFKPGARFHTEHQEGQGMGLFMTKQQLEAMGGRIEVESEENQGTTFKVWLHE
jgi:PAS domain S-box-containing protein